MESAQQLYTTHAPLRLGKLILTSLASKLHEGELNISIFEHCLVESSPAGKNYLPFDFDLKFGYQKTPPAIYFERGEAKQMLGLRSEADLIAWREALKGRLNQRGFHEQFKPKKKIGKGNFASVYLAQKMEIGRNFAVKAFSKQAAYSEDKGKECLIKEIEIMRSLNHPSCMRLYEVFESDNSLYIVVQLLEGGLLHDRIKSKEKPKPFKPHETREVIYSILCGLREMHSKKVMHRDLKPQNLIFRNPDSCECVIADFGLSQFSQAEEYLFVRCGTPGYVAPEVINIKDMKTKYEPICDMFSLGLIFHLMLLGVSAFPGKTYNDVLAQNRASNITFEGEQYKTLDPNTLNLLKRMLKKSPAERITAAEALEHPYFCEAEEIEDEEVDIVPEMIKCAPGQSPIAISSNPLRKQQKIKKDSCLEFKLGKENVFTGKVDTLTETGSTNNSVGKRFESFLSPKASKFNNNNKK